jgi:hypothetical protein
VVDTSDVSFEETNQIRRRTLRRSAGVALAILMLLLLTVSPSRGACVGPTLAFANMRDERSLYVSPGDRVTIVGRFWTRDCFDTDGPGSPGSCSGFGDERPMTDIDVELGRPVTPVAVLAEGLSAGGENESWFLTFRVPELQPGTYRITAHDGDTQGYPTLSLRVSR